MTQVPVCDTANTWQKYIDVLASWPVEVGRLEINLPELSSIPGLEKRKCLATERVTYALQPSINKEEAFKIKEYM